MKFLDLLISQNYSYKFFMSLTKFKKDLYNYIWFLITMGMNYSDEEIDSFREAGKITSKAREFGKKLIKRDSKMVDVCNDVDDFILSNGFDLAFPSQISLNDCAAHYGASYEDPIVFNESHLAKLDLGAMHNGAIGDTAVSVDLSKDGKFEYLIKASREALEKAISLVRPGVYTSLIGKAIGDTALSYGFKPVRNLSGHGIGIFDLHSAPSIPNYDTQDKVEIKEGMTFAIEPFITNGAGVVSEKGNAELFMIEGKTSVRSPITRDFLKNANRFKGLPFARRYLDKEMGPARVNFALKELSSRGVLHEFPPLHDKGNGDVAQSEHSVLVTEDGCEILTK